MMWPTPPYDIRSRLVGSLLCDAVVSNSSVFMTTMMSSGAMVSSIICVSNGALVVLYGHTVCGVGVVCLKGFGLELHFWFEGLISLIWLSGILHYSSGVML